MYNEMNNMIHFIFVLFLKYFLCQCVILHDTSHVRPDLSHLKAWCKNYNIR